MRDRLHSIAIVFVAAVAIATIGCREQVIGDWPTEVQGQVVDTDGMPIRGAFVELSLRRLIEFEASGAGIETMFDGHFAVRGVRPGRYVAVFNEHGPNAMWPFIETRSAEFLVEEGKVTLAPTLRAKRVGMIKVEGIVSAPDGAPIRNVPLDFWIDFPSGGQAHSVRSKSDGFGKFVVELSKNGDYWVRVGPEGKELGRTEFVANGELIKITARPR